MLVLYKYKLRNKKGNLTGKYMKQIYSIDIYGDKISIGGMEEPGRNMFFWPEGNLSNSVITDKMIKDINIGHEIETDTAFIYKIM